MGQKTIRVPLAALTMDQAAPTTITVPLDQLGVDAPAQTTTAVDPQPSQVVEGVKAYGREINPVPMAQAVGNALIPEAVGNAVGLEQSGPMNAIKAMGAAQGEPFRRMQEAYGQGDYVGAAAHALYWAIPLLGPKLSEAAEDFKQGRTGEGIGKSLGVGTAAFGPQALANVRAAVNVPAIAKNPNAAEAAAVRTGIREGVPVDAATASGRKFVQGVQKLADESMIGSQVAGNARQAQADALGRWGNRLAERTHATPVTAEQAGQAVKDATRARVRDFGADATTHYSRLRTIEQNPARATSMQVDVTPTKAALRPLYDTLKREAELVPLQGGKARALTALDKLMNAPDAAPLSLVDSALGDLKSMARADMPELRTQGQSVAAEAVQALETQVTGTARAAGPDVLNALQAGRRATVAKYGARDVLKALRDEPVQVFNQATYAKDAGIAQLREVARLAPQELPKIGRAYLENLLTKATAEGGFSRAQGLFGEWQNLGPQTKQVLFRDPGLVRELDQFFLLAKKIGENPNPSGTALTLAKGTELGLIFSSPVTGVPITLTAGAVSKLLHSPRAARVLTQGFRIPVTNTKAAAAASAEILKIAREQGIELPAAAEADRQAAQPR